MLGPSLGAAGPLRLDEDGGDTYCHSRAGQHRNEFALAAGGRPLPARLLHRMRGVEYTTGAPVAAMIGKARMSLTRVL